MRKTLFSLLLIFVFAGCSKDDTGDVAPADLIHSISLVKKDNALRMGIDLNFKKEVSYQVEYWKAGDETSVNTTEWSAATVSEECTLIMLEQQQDYNFRVHARAENQSTSSEVYKFSTDIVPSRIYTLDMLDDKMSQSPPGYLFYMRNDKPGAVILADTDGEILWYHMFEEAVRAATFDERTNTVSCIIGPNSYQPFAGKRIFVMDLYGNVLLDKEAEKLMPHHEIRRLADGNLLMVHFVPKKFDLTAHGGKEDETVIGDGLVLMNLKGDILWEWDCFSEANPQDDPNIMGKIEMLQMNYRDDWLHANSADIDEEGNYYITFNLISELWKINGKTKEVIYRLGKNGNVDMPENAYMEGVHRVSALSKNEVLVFDNGQKSHFSRGLTFKVDDATRKAEVVHNITLPSEYGSPFQGSVDRISDDLYLFGATMSNSALFTNGKGDIVRSFKTAHQSYRTQYISKIDL